MKCYENLHIKCVYFCAETVKNLCSRYFLCWRPKEIPNRICQHNVGSGAGGKAIIFNMFFDRFWYLASSELTLLLNHIMKNLQYILCRNRATASERKCEVDIFDVEDPRNFQADPVMIMFDAAPAWVTFEQFLICFWSLFWYLASNELTLLLNHVMKKSSHKVGTFCAKTAKENVQLIFFYIEDCVATSRNISMFFK